MSSAIRPLLEYLDAGSVISDSGQVLPIVESRGAWGHRQVSANHALFSGSGEGLQIHRRHFDARLYALARLHGAQVIDDAWLRQIERTSDGWRVHFDVADSNQKADAAYVIDATGRRAAVARRIGVQLTSIDRLISVTQVYVAEDGAPLSPTTLVEAVPDGWWYSAPLPGNGALLSFMTDTDLLSPKRIPDSLDLRSALAADSESRFRLSSCHPASRSEATSARTQFLKVPQGEAWAAAGDAAVALDPLASLGIGHALSSGIHVARLADGHLRSRLDPTYSYQNETRRIVDTFLSRRQAMYRSEPRWQQSPFWQRRQ